MKDQNKKNKYSILPIKMLEALSEVLTFGAEKYSPDNYKDEPVEGYIDSMFRHYVAWKNGEYYDDESGLPHLYHMFANAGFIVCLEEMNRENSFWSFNNVLDIIKHNKITDVQLSFDLPR